MLSGSQTLMLSPRTRELFLTAPLGLGMLCDCLRIGCLALFQGYGVRALAARCQRGQARWRRGKEVTLFRLRARGGQFW